MALINLDSVEVAEDSCISFQKNSDEYGMFSNMHGGYPITISNNSIKSTEALYQMCRYPNYSEIQYNINKQHNGWLAKRYAYVYVNYTRKDWYDINIEIMYWVVTLKCFFHWDIFLPIFLKNKDIPFVEKSQKDDFWGAKLKQGIFRGTNVLGKICNLVGSKLLEFYPIVKNGDTNYIHTVTPPNIPNFLLYGKPIPPVDVVLSKSICDSI